MRLFSMSFGGSASNPKWSVRVLCSSSMVMRASGMEGNCSFKTSAIFTRRQGMINWQICRLRSNSSIKARRLIDRTPPTLNYIRIYKPRLSASIDCWSIRSIDRKTSSRTYSLSKKEIRGILSSTKNLHLDVINETTASRDSEKLICWSKQKEMKQAEAIFRNWITSWVVWPCEERRNN